MRDDGKKIFKIRIIDWTCIRCRSEPDVCRQATEKNKSRSEPGNAPRIGIGHREVVCQK